MGSRSPILITGGAQRLGLYCARRLHHAGYPVIISYRTHRPLIEELEHLGIRTLHADFSTSQGILDFINRLQMITDSLRGIVHNASTWSKDTLGMAAIDNFEALFRVHMLAPYLINMHCHDLLLKSPDPHKDIVHMTDYVVQKGSKKHAAYAATKAGLDNLTRSFAALYAPDIQVNAIAPALIKFNDDDDENYKMQALKKSAMQIEPGEEVIVQSLLFLLENHYITGATLPMDGGRHLI
ncbi:dihydromonapterin reductase / dihydrofolate reductase [Allopseudospirillum japonicum]|uniref:Dihydromonapterin reductase n=1 Tax=Allopseudospirillum japonicum TaxID=64971 RepID=A0A1H6R3G8_9GAMM|nr:dihydromonapterin reductase [Allopseudospirillum japonicum]SEI50313.1 dihydromonapterin reductase / dihydrofolate reductase [Allopseudospirillum japonicum]